MVSHRLLLFKEKSSYPYQATFRCPYCGDSKKSEIKTRGGAYERNGKIKIGCFNCHKSVPSLYHFLEYLDPTLAKEYLAESFMESRPSSYVKKEPEKPKEKKRFSIKGLTRLDKLGWKHPVIQYVAKRKIPAENLQDLYYVDGFNKWVNGILPDKLKEDYDEPRLVIPFFDKDGKLFGCTGRSMKDEPSLRYIAIMFDENENKIFGLDRVDFSKKYYIVEGAIDSFFLPNCLAMAGADANINELPNKGNATVIFDNEPRNKEIHGRMEKALNDGFKVCIWPEWVQPKDINMMIMSGIKNVQEIIDQNTYSGLMGISQLAFWKKTR